MAEHGAGCDLLEIQYLCRCNNNLGTEEQPDVLVVIC